MAYDEQYLARLRDRAWFVPGRDALRISDPTVFAEDRRAPLSGRGTRFSWYRPGELLVRVDADPELPRYLADNDVQRRRPDDPDHWRTAGDRRVDERLDATLAEAAGVELWTTAPDADLPRLIQGARRRRLADRRDVTLNHVAFGEPNGKYMGGPGSVPTRADRPVLPQWFGAAESAQVDLAVLDTGLPVDWSARGSQYRLQGVIRPDDLTGSHEWDLLDENGNSDLDRQAAHGLFICGLVSRHAPELRIDPAQVLHPDGSGDEVEIITQGLATVTAPVVNLSLGCYTDDNRPPPALAEAVQRLLDRGVVVVAAAGNNGRDPDYRGRRFFPAAMCGVIGVGAYDSRADPPIAADFSNRGTWVDVWAPGVELVSDYVPDWRVPSPDWSDPSEPPPGDEPPAGSSTAFVHWSGTSFAAPLVAAEIARRVRSDPTASATIVEDFLDGLPFDPVFGRMYAAGDYTV
ncbi:S8 family peptidase [Nakamurella deserti]|uniref:S8 family peptidase n=1 Tax=Nakamurella deserti TaxID=2164074 RepID=UPI000DBE7DD0|nr:S8/S53 family peptidase [Nakamurella deserti]